MSEASQNSVERSMDDFSQATRALLRAVANNLSEETGADIISDVHDSTGLELPLVTEAYAELANFGHIQPSLVGDALTDTGEGLLASYEQPVHVT